MNRLLNIGVAQKIGTYSDGVEVPANAKLAFVSGTPGMMPDGTYPQGITAQAEQAWKNVLAILAEAGMGVKDLVKVTHDHRFAECPPDRPFEIFEATVRKLRLTVLPCHPYIACIWKRPCQGWHRPNGRCK